VRARALALAVVCGGTLSCTAINENLQRMNAQAQGGHNARRAAASDVPVKLDVGDQLADTGKSLVGAKACTVAERNRFEITAEDEYWFGRSVTARILARYTPGKVYEPSHPAAIYVNEVGQVAAAAAVAHLDRGTGEGNPRRFPAESRLEVNPDRPSPTHGYHFFLVHDPAPNAYAIPGGFIILTDGMLQRTASEEELAGVLAHEVAHVQRGHGVELVKDMQCRHKNSIMGQAGDAMRNASGNGSAIALLPLGKAAELMDSLSKGLVDAITGDGYGAAYELEADSFGARYISGAGYPSLAAADLLTRLGRDPTFVASQSRSHPPPTERISKIDAVVRAEHLEPGHAPAPLARTRRFAQAQSDAGQRPALHSER
jgi:hypothetical protein